MSRKERWIRGLIAAVMVFAAGLFLNDTYASAAGDWKGAKKEIINGYKKYQTSVDVRKYNLNYAKEYTSLKNTMSQVVSETPSLFYAGTQFYVSRNKNTNQIVSITLGYKKDYIKADGAVRKTKIKSTKQKLDEAINQVLLSVLPSMSQVEKAMILHDSLVSSTAYTDNSSDESRTTPVGVFLKHKANCEGYSKAYAILMQRVGIPVKLVSSKKMLHMWNAVRIDKKWYHVDVTWDDPMNAKDKTDQYGRVMHENFLCSTARMQKLKHYDFNGPQAVSTKYDKRYWKNVKSSVFYTNGKWIYMTKKGIEQRDRLDKGTSTVLYNVTGDNLVQFDADNYYFIGYNSIFLYSYKTNSAKVVWKTTDVYSQNCTLDQIKFVNNKLYYRVYEKGKHISNKMTPKEDGTL